MAAPCPRISTLCTHHPRDIPGPWALGPAPLFCFRMEGHWVMCWPHSQGWAWVTSTRG